MESSHLVIFATSGKFVTKFNVLRTIAVPCNYPHRDVLKEKMKLIIY